jgi:hypothetical protein
MSIQRRELYSSSNGDSWYLCREPGGSVMISHEPNISSGGKSSFIEIGKFLAQGNNGPEHEALRRLIGELVDGANEPEKTIR